jgi:hypothetical protein
MTASFVRPVTLAVLAAVSAVPVTAQVAPLPDLIVKRDENRTIPAQRWEFRNVLIEPGGVLTVTKGASDILHLIVRGSFVVHGRIVAEQFDSRERQVSLDVPDHPGFTIRYSNSNNGGFGGYGAGVRTVGGGAGAEGSADFGGGGGGGGVWIYGPPRFEAPGGTARGPQGGIPPPNGTAGGNGARRSNQANGGIVFLDIDGDFDGTGGNIRLMGSDGPPGADGLPGAGASTYYNQGASGGGGGAPGGHGGFLVAFIRGRIVAYPTVDISGGHGGRGGRATNSAAAGGDGEPGPSGAVYWFTPENGGAHLGERVFCD